MGGLKLIADNSNSTNNTSTFPSGDGNSDEKFVPSGDGNSDEGFYDVTTPCIVFAVLCLVGGGYYLYTRYCNHQEQLEKQEREAAQEQLAAELQKQEEKIRQDRLKQQLAEEQSALLKAEEEAKTSEHAKANEETPTPVQTSTEQTASGYMAYFKSSKMMWGAVVLAFLVLACIAYLMLSSGVNAEALVEDDVFLQEGTDTEGLAEVYEDLTSSHSDSQANAESSYAKSATITQ